MPLRPMIAFVMFFSPPRNVSGDAQMQEMTRELIDAAVEAEGRYYLPYRLHGTTAQFRRAPELALGVRIVVRDVRPTMHFRNTQIGE